jgi:A/G-specific adenine glycosylase
VEANTARVLARLFNLRTPIHSARGRQLLWQHSADLMPNRRAPDFNSALLDLGALVCLPRKPRCQTCPVQRFCRATTPESLPIRRTRPETRNLIENHALELKNNCILLEKTGCRWRGMWILPPLGLDRLKRSSFRKPVYESVFPFTHHRVTLRVFRQRARDTKNQAQCWFALPKLAAIPIPSPHRRAIVDLLSGTGAKRSRLAKSCSALRQNTG